MGVIVSTTRRNRVGRHIADQVAELATGDDADVRLIDLAEVALPFLDEPDMPARGNYVWDTTKEWARWVVEPHRSEIEAGFAVLQAALRSGRD
ncbi:NADPH-dependent FMN reductase [Kocuria marina]|uniref:NADPH-dependent FMN reductase n=1 Tax=Kocuria marina TaxID=223184 RepID=UPI0031B7FA24